VTPEPAPAPESGSAGLLEPVAAPVLPG